MAIYGFARLVDDVGDEAPGDRGALLDLVALELRRVFGEPGLGEPLHPLMQELASTVQECELPVGPFERLIAANRMDQVLTRYETFAQLLDYCQLSAAPVGELVLGVFGVGDPEPRCALRSGVRGPAGCRAPPGHLRGSSSRAVYMPREDLDRFGCTDQDLTAPVPSASYAP